MTGFDVGEPDLWDGVDEAVDRIQEPLEFPVGKKSGTHAGADINRALEIATRLDVYTGPDCASSTVRDLVRPIRPNARTEENES